VLAPAAPRNGSTPDRILVRPAPMGQACDRGRRADCQRPQEWGYGSVHAARRARFKGFAASPRTRAPRRQLPSHSPGGERRRKLTGSLDDFLIAPLNLPGSSDTADTLWFAAVRSEPRQCLLLDRVPVLRSSTRLRRGSADERTRSREGSRRRGRRNFGEVMRCSA
jgi:hypothetical protein